MSMETPIVAAFAMVILFEGKLIGFKINAQCPPDAHSSNSRHFRGMHPYDPGIETRNRSFVEWDDAQSWVNSFTPSPQCYVATGTEGRCISHKMCQRNRGV